MSTQPNQPRYRHEVVADNLAAELARARLTGREASRRLGVNHLYVIRRVNGETELSVSDLFMFADLLSINPMVLLENAKNAPTRKGGGVSLPELDSNQQPAG